MTDAVRGSYGKHVFSSVKLVASAAHHGCHVCTILLINMHRSLWRYAAQSQRALKNMRPILRPTAPVLRTRRTVPLPPLLPLHPPPPRPHRLLMQPLVRQTQNRQCHRKVLHLRLRIVLSNRRPVPFCCSTWFGHASALVGRFSWLDFSVILELMWKRMHDWCMGKPVTTARNRIHPRPAGAAQRPHPTPVRPASAAGGQPP